VIAETRQFASELIITNVGASAKVMDISAISLTASSPPVPMLTFSVVIERGGNS
jgi:hypothetical protein